MTSNVPITYSVRSNYFGVKPANAIATCAFYNSADKFSEIYPEESRELKNQTYIDDELAAAEDMEAALEKTRRFDEICDHAGMPNKGWTFSGDEKSNVMLGGDSGTVEKVLGIAWVPKSDTFRFNVTLS